MAVDRKTPTLASDGPTMNGEDYTNEVNEEVEELWDRAAVWLDSVAGTNTITAVADPAILAYSRNQQYNFIPANNNTTAVTIAINGLAAVSIRDIDGVALVADALVAGRLVRLQHDGTNFRYLNKPPDTGVDAFAEIATQSFTASGTYTPHARMIFCKAQLVAPGGGGGGANGAAASVRVTSGGGGAGEYAEAYFSASTIGASQTVTIGAVGTGGTVAGTTGGTGGTSSLGSLLTCIGGSGGVGTGADAADGFDGNGGDGGTGGTGGHLRIPGGQGCQALSYLNTVSTKSNSGGQGGSSFLSGSGQPQTAGDGTTGITGKNYGGGGSGCAESDNSGGAVGGTGGASLLLITEYLRAA